MTVPFPLDAFDHVKEVRPRRAPSGWLSRAALMSVGITAAFHAVVVAAFVLGLKVAAPMLHETQVIVDVLKPAKKAETLDLSAPRLTAPARVTAPPPVIDIAPSPTAMSAAPPVAAPAPPPSVPAAKAGESRTSYLGRLLAQLNRFKHYPPAARAAHIEGVVMVHFVMARSGTLVSAEIAKSSGRPALDHEALALMSRAQPLPPMPDTMAGDVLDAVVPVEFSLHG